MSEQDKIISALEKYGVSKNNKEEIIRLIEKGVDSEIKEVVHSLYHHGNRKILEIDNDQFLQQQLKKAIKKIPNTEENFCIIDQGLEIIYKFDKDFVTEILRQRLQRTPIFICRQVMLPYIINIGGAEPVLKMLDDEINKNDFLLEESWTVVYEILLHESSERLSLINRWLKAGLNKKRKEILLRICLKELGLGHLEFIEPAKKVSPKDWDSLSKEVGDIQVNDANKTEALRAAAIIQKMLNPDIRMSKDWIEKNTKKYPEIAEALSKDWLAKNAVVKFFKDTFKELYGHPVYWNNIFKTVNHYCNKPHSKDVRKKIKKQKSALVEAEILHFLIKEFGEESVKLEAQKGKNTDFFIRCDNEEVLIEAREIEASWREKIFGSVIDTPGRRIYLKFKEKLEKQIKEINKKGKDRQIILCFHVDSDFEDVAGYENAVCGILSAAFPVNKEGVGGESYSIRGETNIFNLDGADCVSAICFYKREAATYIVRNLRAKNKISNEFIGRVGRAFPGEVLFMER